MGKATDSHSLHVAVLARCSLHSLLSPFRTGQEFDKSPENRYDRSRAPQECSEAAAMESTEITIRFKRIEGQVRGLDRMVETRRNYEEVLT